MQLVVRQTVACTVRVGKCIAIVVGAVRGRLHALLEEELQSLLEEE